MAVSETKHAKRKRDRQLDHAARKKVFAAEKAQRKKATQKMRAEGNFFERFRRMRENLSHNDSLGHCDEEFTEYQRRMQAKRAKMTPFEAYQFDTIDPEEDSDAPHLSLVSLYFVWSIYKRAVGARRFIPIFCQLFNSIIVAVQPILAGALINEIIKVPKTHYLAPVAIILLILGVISVLRIFTQDLESYLGQRSTQDIICYVSEQIALKYLRVPVMVRESSEFADKFDRARRFAGNIPHVSSQMIDVLASFLQLVAAAVAVFSISPFILLIVMCSAVPYSIINLRAGRRNRIFWRRYSREFRSSYRIGDALTSSESASEIELNGLSSHLITRMIHARRRHEEAQIYENGRLFWPRVTARSADSLISIGVLFLVVIKIARGQIEIGSFVSIRDLLDRIRQGTYGLFGSIDSAAIGLANATDFMEFMETPERPSGTIKLNDTPNIEFRNVSFRYPGAKKPALQDISFSLSAGESIAIVGENGAGKTTLIKLLIGSYLPSSGQILINGHPLEEMDMESYWAQIGALFQNYSRYDFATLAENVQFGDLKSRYSKERVMDALKMVGLEDLPSRYDKGLDQIMSKDYDPKFPAGLSGGQWQRLCIARAFYRSPNILLLDEPTSAVDAKSEYQIFQNIIKKQQGKTTVIISHRFSTVRKAEKIMVLDKGHIVERGTHDQLMKQDGVYAEMFNLQAEGYN